jgi:formylglycine-generating enzyme
VILKLEVDRCQHDAEEQYPETACDALSKSAEQSGHQEKHQMGADNPQIIRQRLHEKHPFQPKAWLKKRCREPPFGKNLPIFGGFLDQLTHVLLGTCCADLKLYSRREQLMKLLSTLTLLALALVCVPTAHAAIIESFGSGSNQFNMTFVPIGNPGNAAHTTGNPNPAGSVGYNYRMGKYEVSRDMINKANADGNLGITLADMASFGGNGANRPATGVSWNEAARYVNWLNTSKGFAPAYKFELQPGDVGYNANANIQLWQAGDSGYNAANAFRNSQARYFLPSMDEWYKAAYYDPNANGGAGGYWIFPTGSDTLNAVSGGTAEGTAVYGQPTSQGPADIDNTGGLSSYGVMGMGGNVWELEETTFDLLNSSPSSVRGVRGGDWDGNPIFLSASFRFNRDPTFGDINLGFRVASIPEPSSAALLMLGSLGLWQRRKRSS